MRISWADASKTRGRKAEARGELSLRKTPPPLLRSTTTDAPPFFTAAMTRHFWALPAIVQLTLASQGSFSVLDDLLAFPQVCFGFVRVVAVRKLASTAAFPPQLHTTTNH